MLARTIDTMRIARDLDAEMFLDVLARQKRKLRLDTAYSPHQ